jgi:hypothetical protein
LSSTALHTVPDRRIWSPSYYQSKGTSFSISYHFVDPAPTECTYTSQQRTWDCVPRGW